MTEKRQFVMEHHIEGRIDDKHAVVLQAVNTLSDHADLDMATTEHFAAKHPAKRIFITITIEVEK